MEIVNDFHKYASMRLFSTIEQRFAMEQSLLFLEYFSIYSHCYSLFCFSVKSQIT